MGPAGESSQTGKLARGTVKEIGRWGQTAGSGVATVSQYLGRTIIARAAAATISEIGHFTADRTRQLIDYAALKLVKDGRKPLPPENGWGDVGRRLGSISAYELQLIDEKIRDVGLIDFADMLGVKDPGELLKLAELRQRASKGDEEAQYALAARFCPPPFLKHDRCHRCRRTFGVTRYRHHCRHCGESFCQDHSNFRHAIPKIGYMTPARVCHGCKAQLEEEDLKDRIVWRMVRVEAFLQNHLIPYFEPGDHTQLDKALRVVGGALTNAAKKAPLTSALASEAMELLRKYGLSGMAGILLRHEYVEAVEMLKEISGVDVAWPVSVNQLSAAMYYLLAKGRGERGGAPDAEQEEHRVCAPISDTLLQDLLNMAPLALHFAYSPNPVEMQLKAQQQGWRLIFSHHEVQPGQPGFSLFCHMERKEACLVVRGPDHVFDIIPEIRGLPLPFPHAVNGEQKNGWTKVPGTERLASCGVGEAAHFLFSEVYPHIRKLMSEYYTLTLLGHSLGGAIAALLGVMLREEGITEGLKCYTFGSPSCVNGHLAQLCEAFSTVVVLHDDVVPRITPSAVRELLRDLLQERETVEQHWQDDVEAIIVKSKGRWTPRWRRVSAAKASRSAPSSFVRCEGDDEADHSQQNGEDGGRRSRSGTGGGDGGGEHDPAGWDSCDEDFVDYWGVGCTRAPPTRPLASNPDSYSIRHEDGTTTTVDLSAVRRRLLESSSPAPSVPPPSVSIPPRPAAGEEVDASFDRPTSSSRSRDSENGGGRVMNGRGMGGDSDGEEGHDEGNGFAEEEDEEEEEDGNTPFFPMGFYDDDDGEEDQSGEAGGEEEEDEEEEGYLAHSAEGSPRSDARSSPRGGGEGGAASAAALLGAGLVDPAAAKRPSRSPRSSGWGSLGMANGVHHHDEREEEEEETDVAARYRPPPRGRERDEEEPEGEIVEDEDEGVEVADEPDGGVLVEDVNLPEMYPPGRVVHIYSYRGVYRACMPNREFRGLRRLSLQGNMLKDHDPKAYFHALCEVIDVRRAPQVPPVWEGFKDAEACACCGVDLTWQCAAASEAQRYRDKHNCRCCGRLVCQSCSTHRQALPSIGLGLPARVCDRCFFGGKYSSDTPQA